MTYCKHCNAKLENGAIFCSKCGTQNAPASQAPQAGQAVYYVKPQVPGRGFGITSMVVSIIGLVYGLSSLSGANIMASIAGRTHMGGALVVSILLYASLSVMAIPFAEIAHSRGYQNGISRSGLIMGRLGFAVWLAVLLICLKSMYS